MYQQRKHIAILLTLAAVALLAVGCGGSADTSPSLSTANSELPTDGPLTKAEFIKQGDALCERAQAKQYNDARRYRTVQAKELGSLSLREVEERLIRLIVLPSVRDQAKGLDSLPAPAGQEKKIKTIVAEIEAAVKKAEKVPLSAESEVGYGENPFHGVDIELRDYGFSFCNGLP